jgi:hypothetical protein
MQGQLALIDVAACDLQRTHRSVSSHQSSDLGKNGMVDSATATMRTHLPLHISQFTHPTPPAAFCLLACFAARRVKMARCCVI